MAVDDKISLIDKSWWPTYFQDNSPTLLAFIKIYYEYLEQPENCLWYARQHVQNRDVDKTIDEFLIHFKAKYIPDIQLQTVLETREMVKNSLPFYRSRGTDLSFDLFFRSVFGVNANVYHPWDDVFMLSSGKWNINTYLEISPLSNNFPYIGQEIFGFQSGAVAFVDRYVRRIINSKMIDVYYISAITGTFVAGEQIGLVNENQSKNPPTIVGSVNQLQIIEGGSNFKVGETVSINSSTGILGQAIVSNIQTVTGSVNFNLLNGGWGYSDNVQIYISNYEILLSNVSRPLSESTPSLLYPVIQPLCDIQYAYANGIFAAGETVSVYNGGGIMLGQGVILEVFSTSTTTGNLFVSVLSGNLNANTVYYNEGNVVTANLVASGFTDVSANGILLNIPTNNVYVNYINMNEIFLVGSNVYQVDTANDIIFQGKISNVISVIGSSGILSLANCSTLPFTNTYLYQSNNIYANVTSLEFNIGVQSNSNYTSYLHNYVYSSNIFTSATVSTIDVGYGASFEVSNTRNFAEEVTVSFDAILPMLNVPLNATNYGSNLNFANLTSVTLGDSFTYTTINIGSLTLLTDVNPGQNYTVPPYVVVIDPIISRFYLYDFIFSIVSLTGIFSVGEIITGKTSGSTGIVKSANSTSVKVERITFETSWINSEILVGQYSGSTATLVSFARDVSSFPIGTDSVITSNVVSVEGSVATLNVFNSGFGFNRSIEIDNVYEDYVTFTSQDQKNSGTAFAILGGQGKSAGYYSDENGFLSHTKYLSDSYYYTPFSYEVQTSLSPNLYLTMLKKLLHAAGKVYFTAVYWESILSTPVNIVSSTLERGDVFVIFCPSVSCATSTGIVKIRKMEQATAHAGINKLIPYAAKAGTSASVGSPSKWIQIVGSSATATATAHNGALNIGGNIKALIGSATVKATAKAVTVTHT